MKFRHDFEILAVNAKAKHLPLIQFGTKITLVNKKCENSSLQVQSVSFAPAPAATSFSEGHGLHVALVDPGRLH